MPSPPYAILLVSINAGAPQSGGITAAAGASCQLSYESTVGWPSTPPPYVEIFAYPDGWDPGVGWVTESVVQPQGGTADVFRYYGATPPPAFTLPDADHWGDVLFALVVGDGKKAGKLSSDMVDTSTGVRIESPGLGLHDVAYRAGGQFHAWKKWVAAIQRDLRLLDTVLGSGSGLSGYAYLLDSTTVPGGLPSAVAGRAMSSTLMFRQAAVTGAVRTVVKVSLSITNNSGHGAAGDGAALAFEAPDSVGAAKVLGRLRFSWTNPAALSPRADFTLSVLGTDGEIDALQIADTGDLTFKVPSGVARSLLCDGQAASLRFGAAQRSGTGSADGVPVTVAAGAGQAQAGGAANTNGADAIVGSGAAGTGGGGAAGSAGSVLLKTGIAADGTGGTTRLSIAGDGTTVLSGPVALSLPVAFPSHVKAALPSAATYNGRTILVTDQTGGQGLCTSNGTDWISDRTGVAVI